MNPSLVNIHPPVAPEDQARAEFYALLARLYGAPPDAAVLAALGASDTWTVETDGALATAWNRLVLASAAMDAEAAEQEYNDLFVGVGKSEVNLHASHWIAGFMMEKPLADLRTELARLGLGRQPGTNVLEDQMGALFETMRILITGTPERRPASLTTQRAFFETQIAPWAVACCDAISTSAVANYYRRVAEFTKLFLAVERDSLAIE